MEIFVHPERQRWKKILERPYADNSDVMQKVRTVLDQVKARGDEALRQFSLQFDGVAPQQLELGEEEMLQSIHQLDNELTASIMIAAGNIQNFHEAQRTAVKRIETTPGVFCWQKAVAVEKVGLYIPGGTAPLFSTVLMLALPAKLAGCKEIVLCTPPDKNGRLHPAIVVSAKLAGVTRIFKIGGAQAIAAMAYGTETVPAVHKIFGPGNQYVTAAKQLVQAEGLAIDLPAGPSEVCVWADETSNPVFVAADLLSQAEHGADSQVLLVASSEAVVQTSLVEVEKQLAKLPRKDIAALALKNSKAIVLHEADAVDLINDYAPEHLIVATKNAEADAGKIINAGSVFIGPYSPESVGDYASGTNHTLPTNGHAKAYSGVNLDSFLKKITYQQLTEHGLWHLGRVVMKMAEAEGLRAHAEAVRVRVEVISRQQKQNESLPSTETAEEKTWKGVEALVRENIKKLRPYSSARSEFSGTAKIFLDANENSFGSPLTKWYNRYPDPLQWELKKKIAAIKNVAAENMLLGNGSDECIDLLIRAFCEPAQDSIIICPPTYGMYEVNAHINNVAVKEVPLLQNFQLNLQGIEAAVDASTKIIFLCSPNNPTGNSLEHEDIEIILNNFHGLVVIDEAYINYSRHRSFVSELKEYPNLAIMQTFSKAWGLAALRLGMLFASEEIVQVLNKIKPPYNINQATQELAMQALNHLDDVNLMITETVKEREALVKELATLGFVQKIYPSDANFLLVKMQDANKVYNFLKNRGIIVRNRSNVILCEDCLRITVGTPQENRQLLKTLKQYE